MALAIIGCLTIGIGSVIMRATPEYESKSGWRIRERLAVTLEVLSEWTWALFERF